MYDKTLSKMGTEGSYINTTKATYEKLKANIILDGEKIKLFPLRVRNKGEPRWRCR